VVGSVGYGNKYTTRVRGYGFNQFPRRGTYRTAGVYGRFQPGGVERKWFDETITAVAVPNNGVINATINPIPQGAGQSERVGSKCILTNIMLRGAVNIAAGQTGVFASDRVRAVLYLDKQSNGAAATVTDILTTATIDSFNNLFNKDRFVILRDMYIDISSDFEAATAFSTETFQIYKTCRIPIEWSGATGAMGEIRSNNVGLLFISESGASTVEYVTRLRFEDP